MDLAVRLISDQRDDAGILLLIQNSVYIELTLADGECLTRIFSECLEQSKALIRALYKSCRRTQ